MGLHPYHTVIGLLIALACVACNDTARDEVKPPVRKAPVVTGTDQNGAVFSSASLAGRPWIASFFFASCQTVCPMLNNVVAKLQREAPGMSFVSITTDPDNDIPSVMKEYGKSYGATNRWHFVNMPTDVMREMSTKGFGVMDPKEPDMHSTRLVLVDADGMIREYVDCEDNAAVERLQRIIKTFTR